MSTPHDALFKRVLGDPQHAGSMLRSALPPALAQRIDWQSLMPVPISFVDEELSERYADLLFSASVESSTALVYVLYEHQSSHDDWMALRLLDYCVRAWADWRRKHPEAQRLPAIVPVVLHHSEKGWSCSTRFADLIDLDDAAKDALGPHLIDFRFMLDDLTRQTDEQIHARALTELAEVVALSFKHLPYDADPLAVVKRLEPLLHKVQASPNGASALHAVLRYVLQVAKDLEVTALRPIARRFGKSAEEALMTAAEKLEQQGIAKGIVTGSSGILLRQLERKFGPLPTPVIERVTSASTKQIESWADRILFATTLDEVLR